MFNSMNVRKVSPLLNIGKTKKKFSLMKKMENAKKNTKKIDSKKKSNVFQASGGLKRFLSGRKSITEGKTKNYLRIVFFVKKFSEILKTRTQESKLKKIKSFQENIFCDLTFFRSNERRKDKERLNNPFYRLHVKFQEL